MGAACQDVVLLDGNNLAHRAWHAARANVEAADGLFHAMVAAAMHARPRYAAVAFDSRGCFRRAIDPNYKAHRKPRDVGFDDWLDWIMAAGAVCWAPVVRAPAHEADDVIATLVAQAQAMSLRSTIVTSDRDIWALVSPLVVVQTPDGAIVDVDRVYVRMGVWPWQVPAYKALAGDASDNICGVPGIGAVRAARLLQAHNTLDAALDHLTAPPVKGDLAAARQSGRRAAELVALRRDAPVDLPLALCRRLAS